MRKIRTLAGLRGGRSLRLVILGLVLALAPLLALVPLGTVQAASGDCVTTNGQTTCTFTYTGDVQTWTVPDGVTEATFNVLGAQGGSIPHFTFGGQGGEATATLALTPGEQVILLLGGVGVSGGGAGGSGFVRGAGGGGASDVRLGGTDLAHRVLVAGGGGGAADAVGNAYANGGAGGGLSGGNGVNANGGAGGAGGNQDGTTGSGQLGQGSSGTAGFAGGGGGGGGYYGGAGGPQEAGGGGGSGFGPPGTVFQSGVRAGNGQISITFTDSIPPTTTGTLTTGTNAAYSPGTWSTQPVTVTLSASDTGGSGVAQTYYAVDTPACTTSNVAACTVYAAPFTVSTDGSHTLAYFSVDEAGNVEPAQTAAIDIDTTAPTIALTSPTDGAAYAIGQHVLASYSCDDATSGIAPNGCSGTVTSGSPITTDALGSQSFTVTATDTAGNTTTQTVSYSVGYGIRVLSSQTTPIPRGSVALVRLEVVDGQGHNLSSRSLTVTALNLAPVDQPWNGQHGNFARPFLYSPWLAPGGGYLLIVPTYTLQPGTYVLSFQVAGDPSIHTLQFVVRQGP